MTSLDNINQFAKTLQNVRWEKFEVNFLLHSQTGSVKPIKQV